MYDILIIGAGPAGLTSALYALRANKKVLILEQKNYGGQIINAEKIENYPGILEISGFDFATNLYNQVKKLGVTIKYETVEKITEEKIVQTNQNSYKAKAIIIATGTEAKKLNLVNENKWIGKGISYCATCDGAFFKDKIVAVNGGGNTAVEDAIYLSDIAKKVYLIHRRDKFRAEDKYVSQLKKKKNIELILNATISSLNGNNQLEKITIKKNDNQEETIQIDGLFIAIGQNPQNDRFKNVVELNEKGYIKSQDGVHTKTKGIYVAGDTREKILRQLTTAISDGSLAATIAINEMKEKDEKK